MEKHYHSLQVILQSGILLQKSLLYLICIYRLQSLQRYPHYFRSLFWILRPLLTKNVLAFFLQRRQPYIFLVDLVDGSVAGLLENAESYHFYLYYS